ncbi:nesprin-2 isoform X3 [Trematomus bernacchii]|uniref:nesprin-2 isoform X3 n=1 Tax=Trematomus bernacchii TaxID=40690 RepID=UPI00146AE1A8|nr:nesprin-2 isoform X3 [Trematomus bernacchii]
MASGVAEEDDGGIPLDIDNVHMLLQVEHEQIQKRTFTNWINAQLSKRCPPSFVSDLFSDLRDGSQLLDLLEVMSGQPMKRQRGRGVFQQRANIDTALNFLKKKSIKMVNINIPDIIDGRPSIILGLIWTIILHCHIEELASTLSYSSCHSSLDSLCSLDSRSSSPATPLPAGRTSPLHKRFRISAKKALLMWVRDQCQKVGCSVSVKNFKSSWRSGEVFLAILCSLRPQLADLSLVQSRSNQENLEEAFHLAERELHIPRLLDPQDVDVPDPDEKSIMTYVAQFLQYSNDMPAPDDHLQLFPVVQPFSLSPVNLPAQFTPAVAVSPLRQVSPSERALEVTCWLQQTYDELSEARTATEKSSFAEKYQVFQNLFGSFTEQRRPVMTLLAAVRRRPELSQEQCALRTAWDRLEAELQICKADLDSSLPPPLDSVVVWLQRAEEALTEEGGGVKDHAGAAKEARAQQDTQKTLIKEMSYYVNIMDTYRNMDDSGNIVVPLENFDEIKRRLTNIRVTAKYQGIKLEYQESRHTVLDVLSRISAKVQIWKAAYSSQEAVLQLLQDWHETVERQCLLLILMDSLQTLKEKANNYTSKAALGEDSQLVARQVKEAENEVEQITQPVTAVRWTMERVVSAWEIYNKCLCSLQTWLAQKHSPAQSPAARTKDMSEWTACQAKLNEAGNFLIEVTESTTSRTMAEQLSKVNMQWAECMKRTMFEVSSEPSVGPPSLQTMHSLTQEASWLLRQPLEVASVPLKATRQKLQGLSKKMAEVDLSCLSPSTELQTSNTVNLQKTLPQVLAAAETNCAELQRAASGLEGRLAELDRWSSEALDWHQHREDRKHRGRSALEPAAKVLISRGPQLENQVVSEGQDLLNLVARVQKTSPLQNLSTSDLQDRISEAVSHCQEIFGMFCSLGFLQHVETSRKTPGEPEAGLFVVARTKHVHQIGNVMLQNQDPCLASPETPSFTPQPRMTGLRGWTKNQPVNTNDKPTIVITQAEPEPVIQLFSKSNTRVSCPSQKDRPLPARIQTPVGPKCAKSPVLSKHVTSPDPKSQTSTTRIRGQPNTVQSDTTSPKPLVMVRSEVHSKAQSMARSRLEKARSHLQGRIQQAIRLFGGREVSVSQAKKKQKALKILQPSILDEFLSAVECLGAFCTGPQLQDLMLLSDSVRKQWEDVRRDMAAFVPIFWCQIRDGNQSFSAVQCETQTNTLHVTTDQTDHDSVSQHQVVMDGAASDEVESLQELCETLTQGQSFCQATDQLQESDEAQETQSSDTVLTSDCRGRQPRGTPLLRMSADTQHSNRQKQSVDRQQQDLSPVCGSVTAQPQGDILHLRAQDVPAEREGERRSCGLEKKLKSALRSKEQPLKARLLHFTESSLQTQAHIQAVVRGDTVETKQEAEWTVIPETAASQQEVISSEQEILERYRKSCSAFQSQLQKTKQHLEAFIQDSVSFSTLRDRKKQLQTSKQETEALWFEFELQYSQFSHLMTKEDEGEVERSREQLTQQWRGQQMYLQSRMKSLENTADLMESADGHMVLITENLERIVRESVDISSFSLTDARLESNLKEMDDGLRSEMRKLSERVADEERTSPSSLCQALHNRLHHLRQLRQRLEEVQAAAQALKCFLATVREVEAEIPALQANQDSRRQEHESDRQQERLSWQAAMQQRLQAARTQSDGVDSTLKAVGMTLTMDGANVTCQDVVTSLSQQVLEIEKELKTGGKRDGKDGFFSVRMEQIQQLNPKEIHQTKPGEGSTQQGGAQEQLTACKMEEEAKRRKLEEDDDKNTLKKEEAPTRKSEEDVLKERRRRNSQVQKEGEKKSMVQRRFALLGALREIRGAAEQLRLQEPSLPALQHRTRALTDLESRLAGHLAELQHIREESSRSGDVSRTREAEELWEEATKAVTERLEQCNALTELLKRFQSIRGDLSGKLQRAESTISEQASYMGRENLQRLHTKVQDTKSELIGLGDGIEEVRSVCRQLHTHLRQIPECTMIPFEDEADALMDRWLDISERTDSHLESLHRGLTLWDGVLQLGEEVERWTGNKLAAFAECPSFQTEEDISALQNEIVTQEESMEHFHQRATEIQALLQSTEPPLELQVVETQMRKKTEQLQELVSEAEDVYRQMVAAKGHITVRMAECFSSLQKIQDSLLTLTGADVAAVLATLKDLLFELQAQDEQAESVQEDLNVMASIASPVILQSLSADWVELQEKVRHTQQLFSEVEEQTVRNIQDLDRLQRETEHIQQWLEGAEEKAATDEGLSVLQEEALQQRVRTEELNQLVSSLQSSPLQQCAVVEQSRKLLQQYHNFLQGSTEEQSRDMEEFQTPLKSTQPSDGDLRGTVDSPLGENLSTKSPGVCPRLEEVVCNEEQLGQSLQAVNHKLTSLQEKMSACQAQKESSAALITDAPALEALLHEVTDVEKYLSQIATLKDTITAISTAEAQASFSQEISNLQNHQRALDSSIREKLALLTENSLPAHNKTLITRQENIEPLQTDTILTQDSQFPAIGKDTPEEIKSTHCVTTLVGSQATELDHFPLSTPGNVSEHLAAQSVTGAQEQETQLGVTQKKVFTIVLDMEPHHMQGNDSVGTAQSETLTTVTGAQEKRESCEDISVSPAKVFTIVLDMEMPDFQPLDNIHMSSTLENKSRVSSRLMSPESDETDFHYLKSHASNEPQVEDTLTPIVSKAMEDSTSAKVSCKEKSQTHQLMQNEVLNPSKSCGVVTECELTGAHAAETTCPDVKQEDTTTFCHVEKQTMNSVSSAVEGEALPDKQIPAADIKQLTAADTAQSAGTGQCERVEGGNTGGETNPEQPQGNVFEVPKRRYKAMLLFEGSEWKVPASLEDTEGTQGQMEDSMDPERTAGGATGESAESFKPKSTMQDVLSEIQSLVEKSNIINRDPHIDLNWYLKSSPGEPEIRLVRTVQKVLACRYQPAQLDVHTMTEQLQEAEDYMCRVQEQVATMKSMRSAGICDPEALKRVEGQWSAALLDASATVQVKAAQLDQVQQYHKQMRITRAFLEVVAAEKDNMALGSLGSSALQADRLNALLQTMVKKRDIMEALLQLSSQFSVHLSDAESSGALSAQLGDVQEEWKLLEGSIQRALQHASSSTSQSSLLLQEAEQLKANLEALGESSFQSHDNKSALEVVCLTTDLKLYNQLYVHLQSQADALVHFSLGQKEKDEIKRSLQELGSLLSVTKSKLSTSSTSSGDVSSAKISKQLQDLIIGAKQAENHISIGKKLALFPEEARIQIVEMKKFQTDIWFRRSKMQVEVEQIKETLSDKEKDESDQELKTIEDLYEAIADSLDHVLDTMKKSLQEREKLLSQLANMEAWLAQTHAERDPCTHVENVSKADIRKLESKLKSHTLATVEIESQLQDVGAMADSCREIAVGLSPGESRYLVNRMSGLRTELEGLLAHEKAACWELEELIHERTTSDEELSTIQASLKQISTDLEQQRFPLTQETLTTCAHLKHMLIEHQCQVQELQHCQEARRCSLLCTIGELQDQCKALSVNAIEQDKYLHLRRQMEESRDIAEEQIQRAKDKTISVGERVRLCQTLLVELPLVKTQCQEAADQLEAIAQELYPSEYDSEKQRIRSTVETLVSWEHSVADDIKNLEGKLLLGLRFSSELPALIELFLTTRDELQGAEPVTPDEKAIDIALRRNWIIWRNMESGMRVLGGLGRKKKVNLKRYKELYSLREAAMQECHLRMESLCQARESLKDYQWAAQGAIGFLHNAEATFLSAPGGFLDCTEEQRQTHQALEALEDGFQAHICHLVELVPQQPCLSRPKTEQLHICIVSQLLVGRAILEAQAQLRLESLQRCEIRQQSHRKCHEDIRQRLSGFEAKLSECAAEQVTSYDKCVAQQREAKLLMEGLRSLAGKIEELRAGCPMQGCGVGKDGELSALWRRWVSLRRGVGLLMAHTEQKGEEWKDITTSMEQCCSSLAGLQADVPDSSTVNFTEEEPLELLAQAEMHQTGLEQEQQALASLEHRLEHALSLSSSQVPISPGPVGKTLVKIQENVRSLKERNQLVVAAAKAEEKEREHLQEEIGEVAQHMFALLPSLEDCSNPSRQQELRQDLSSQKTKLQSITAGVQSRYAEIPADISRRLQEVQLSIQREEEKLMETSDPVRKLAREAAGLGSSLEKVNVLLEQKSPTVKEAQNVLKHAWDVLDAWHSRLMLLESKVQDLAEEDPDQTHLLFDQLTQPLQLYQDTVQRTEQRTAFLNKIPACLQEFEDILYSATCWLDEAQSWLSSSCSFTTARGLQNHANSLQLVLDDSERIRHTLQNFRPALEEISAVCDISAHEERVNHNDQQVHTMQCRILEPLDQLLQTAVVVEAIEAELKTMEKNVPKIQAILSSVDNSDITLTEHLQNRQVILANMQSMQRTLEEMETCKGELPLPQGAGGSLLVFSRARHLLQPLEELEHLTQQQVTLLENRIKEEETCKDLGINTVSDATEEMQQPYRFSQRGLFQEMFVVSNSEEEEDDDENESCHSSSSDTLTCSIPEDPEETLNLSDVQTEDIAERKPLSAVKAVESLAAQFSSEVEPSTNVAEAGLISVKPGLHIKDSGSQSVETESITMDYKALSLVTVTAEPLLAAPDQRGSPGHETLVADTHGKSIQSEAAVEDTRLIPARPRTPFTATRASDESLEGEEEHPSLTTAPEQDLGTLNVSRGQSEVSTSHSGLLEESKPAQESSEEPISLAADEDMEQLRWSTLHTQISQKLTTLKKVKEEHQISSEDTVTHAKDSEREIISTGSSSAVLQRTHESITVLRQIVSSPGVSEELYEAARRVLLCLDALTDLLLTPAEEDPQLRLLQQECVSTELATLSELLGKVESESKPLKEKPEALRCLSSLQDGLHTAQLLLTSSHHLIEHLGHTHQHQVPASNQLCILDEFELGQSEMFPSIQDAPSLEQCVLGRHLRESPGEKVKLQQASRSLLQGITRLLELGEECITGGQRSQVHNCSPLQALLCRDKKLLRVLRSQLAFVQHLFQREPGALRCQEDERVQLVVRATALQHQALEQEVASQRTIQEWTRWEDNCRRLGELLDDVEVFISSGEPEGDDERLAQQRQEACQQTLVQLEESRAVLGLILDQGKRLQTEPQFAASVCQAGGALELRWQSACRRTEQERRRCTDIQDSWARFQTDFAAVSEWLLGANKHQKTWSNLADTSDLSQECVRNNLIKLLDFSMEIEAVSVQRASAARRANQLLHLREADCPGLRAQLTQLEGSWSQLTSDLSKIQDRLQQRLLAAWPPVELLSDLEDRLKKLQAQLDQERETVPMAEDAAQITKVLQHYRELKAGLLNGQLLLDFLCQSGPPVLGVDVRALRSERTMFAEKLGALRLQWLLLQRELESQIDEAEQMHHTCADREKRLQRLHGWIEQQEKTLNQWKQPTSLTLAREALLKWGAAVSKVKEVAAALQELKATRVHVEKGEDHPCDISFSDRTERVRQACADLKQQMEALRPAVQQSVEQWSRFESDLREVSLQTTRGRCALQNQPLFSLKQAEGHVDFLQQLQEKAGKGEELWASVDNSYQMVVKTLHPGTTQALDDQMRGEQKRWRAVVQELEDEHMKTAETLSLWQEFTLLSDHCSSQWQTLQLQWEEIRRSQQDTQTTLQSLEKLRDAADDLQSSVGDVLAASKPLIGRLEPLAAHFIQSETRLLSRDVVLLSQAMSGKKKSLQDDLEQRELFQSRLEAIEKQTQNTQQKLKTSFKNPDSVKQVLLELRDVFPLLVDVREMSVYLSLSDQERQRVHTLSRLWAESMTHASHRNSELQAVCQHSQSFQEKCKNLTSLQKKLEDESLSKETQRFSSLQEMLTVHQRLGAETTIGHQLLQALLCDAVESMEKETGQKRSQLMAQVTCVRQSWLQSVALAGQRRSFIKEQLGEWRVYRRGSKLLWKLLRDVDPLLPPAGPAVCSLQQLRSCADDYQCVEDALALHSTVCSQTLEAGRRLCETTTESECQALQHAWDRTGTLLQSRGRLVSTTLQKWSQCQERIMSITSELDDLNTTLKPPLADNETHIQETDFSLQRLTRGFREVATMKTDLTQYVAAGDSALLERQLEQLHVQWEELRTKVSLRRQEIADRLNAWTIFNDKNKEFCDWLTQMENKVCHSGDLSIEEMVEKLKKDCMEEINLFSENKSHLKQLGEQLLSASDEAKQTQVHGSLQEVNQRWHNLFHNIEARVKKLKETLAAVQQLDKNMSNLRSWLCRIEADLSRPVTYSVCHHQEIQKRLAEEQGLQRDIEQHTEGVASVLSLCDVLLRDEDAAGGNEAESDSLQETSHSLDQRWRAVCSLALDRRLSRIEETWRLWCKFLDDYSRFEDWLKMAERTAANPNSADVLYTVAKEELKKFEGFQRQVHERLTHLELVNNQYRRLARENRTDRASQLKAMVHEGNQRWDTLHRRVAAILRRLRHFTGQREEFEGTRESMLVWLTELDLQLTNVEHFSESEVHHKIQQLNSFQKEITLNTERIDGLIVFGEGLIQKSCPQDAALIEEELEELHSYCQEVFSRLVRFHQRLSQPPIKEEPELSRSTFYLESSLELIGRPRLGRSQGSLLATPTHLLASPLERSGRETPVSVDSLPLEWDHTGDVGGSSHEEDEEEEEHEDDRTYFSALSALVCPLSPPEVTESQEDFVEAPEAQRASSLVSSLEALESPRWRSQEDAETQSLQLDSEGHTEAPPTLTSTPRKQGYLHLMSQCSGSIEDIKRVSLILDDEERPEELGLTGLTASDKQSGVIERWELIQAQSRSDLHADPQEPQNLSSDLDDITSWLEKVTPELERLQQSDPAASIEDMAARAKELKEMQKMFTRYKSIMLSVNLRAPELQRVAAMNRGWSRACSSLQLWDSSLRGTLMRCQEFHERLHSLLLWLAHAESRRYAVDIRDPHTPVAALQQHRNTLTALQAELQARQAQQVELQALWAQLQPEDGAEEEEESREAQEKLHVTGSKLKLLLRQVEQDLSTLPPQLGCESASEVQGQSSSADPKKGSSPKRERRDLSPPRSSFFYRVLRAAFPLHLLFLFLLLLPCIIPWSESEPGCTAANNFARSFYPMLKYTNGPPPHLTTLRTN